MTNHSSLHVATLIPFLAVSAHAEVTLDGTLGRPGALPGPNYQIGADFGQQHGSNLFHSFQDFNLQSHESATFSGPANVQNIISRVTGGNPSSIDGTLRSTIPHADLYFLNPYGILFGLNARLDVQGGFHASTADYLRLGENGRFEARNPNHSILTVAPPTAFGFLNVSTDIQVQGSQLTVAPHADFSLMGGNLTLNHAQLTVESGRINLVSVASTGEVTAKMDRLEARVPDTAHFSQLGQIQMENTQVEISGSPSGGISIRGGQFWMNNSLIHGHNKGSEAGNGIDIENRDSMSMRGDVLSELQPTAEGETFGIISDTLGMGKAGDISITTPHLEVYQNTIDGSTKGEGEGGNINIRTQRTHLGEGAEILSNAYDFGHGGQINIKATERLELNDRRIFETPEEAKNSQKTWIQTNIFGKGNGGDITIDTNHLQLFGAHLLSDTDGQGHGGTITINANTMELLNGSAIVTAALPQSTGNSGKIRLNIADTLTLSGFKPGWTHDGSLSIHNIQTGIGSITNSKGHSGLLEISARNLIISDYATVGSATVGTGNAGSMMITIDNLYLQNGGILTNSSGAIIGGDLWLATGHSGNLTVIAKEDIIIEGHNPFNPSSIATNTFLSGQGGNIELQANRLILRNGGTITANSLGTGNAGNIGIIANEIDLSSSGEITSAAMQAVGGNIEVTVGTLFYLQDSQVTTSVMGGIGNGGNITTGNPQFVVLNHGQIIAQADEGHGGNIRIIANQLLTTPDSLISASSRVGLDGHVLITSPDQTIGNSLLASPKTVRDMSGLFPRRCDRMSFEEFLNRSTFYVYPIAGSTLSPYDFKPSHAFRSFPKLPTVSLARISQERRAIEGQRLAWLMGCHS